MPLNSQSPTYLHLLQNISLILLSLSFIPLCTAIAIFSHITSPFAKTTKHIKHNRKWRGQSSAIFRPRTVLVTGVGMSKGLAIARAFYRGGHRVIGADFEPYRVPVCGRFSVALERFYRLAKPGPGKGGSRTYVDSLVEIVKKEKVEVWVSCSGVASAVEDGEGKEAVERLTSCKAIQFGVALTETLHEKYSFIENTRKLGLNVPETHLVLSIDEACERIFRPTRYIMKSVGLDDSIRADMTILPLSTMAQTRTHIAKLSPSPSRPFVLQQFVSGPEYCTHSLIIRGRVLAFAACRSAELLMHYRALPPSSQVSQAMLKYTELYAQKTGPSMTGHFSLDFLLDAAADPSEDLMQRIYPIECNPRAHTAVVLFADQSEQLADAYLSVLPDHPPPAPSSTQTEASRIIVPTTNVGYYWIGHDLVTRIILSFGTFSTGKVDFWWFGANWVEFIEHVIFWKDGTYEIWDPWPFWALYCLYLPCMFAVAILTGRWWSRCNVSTTKMFAC